MSPFIQGIIEHCVCKDEHYFDIIDDRIET